MRMLDNVIDINYYAVKKARDSNMRHRPVGLGIMGFQDCLHLTHTPYASDAAKQIVREILRDLGLEPVTADTSAAEVSDFALVDEIAEVYPGMMMAVPPARWPNLTRSRATTVSAAPA